MKAWQFKDPPNAAVLANRKIISGENWIAYVSHDAADGAWQFHNNDPEPPKEVKGAVVSLCNIVQLDETVTELADLPLGWHAWRDSTASLWRRAKIS